MLNEELNLYDIEIDQSKRYFKYKKQSINFIKLILIISILAVISRVGINFYKASLENKKVQSSENIVQTNTQESESQEKVKNGYISNEIFDGSYKHYVDNEFGFYCAYPSQFIAGDSIGGGNRITFTSPDGKVVMFVGAVKNTLNLSAKDIMDQYVIDAGGKVEYKANGDTWYVVSNKIGDTTYYRKCFVDDLIYWFEFNVKDGSNEEVGKYIEYIEDHFKKV